MTSEEHTEFKIKSKILNRNVDILGGEISEEKIIKC